ncbi:PDZ domain-containing protein [Novosphingobium sp. KCTC 2891]|uniref:PDZ domain-containing protein n=1 Tax=Novosphingobium sp. KCTC 2891 TaxID=2989730 RepID=UPI002222088D|nr:PDZ domain-containing protein [Novosphingobium sp. KCTC 2891]MCW1383793.1 PDZ domain-containing protein [Novosphingobium sp. KCTC 2891]
MAADYARSQGFLDHRKVSTAMMFGLEGPLLNATFSLKSLSLSGFTLRQIPVQVIEDWKLAEPVSIGWSLLSAFDVLLSLGSRSVQLKADRDALAADFPKDRLGLFGQRQSDRLIVFHVAPGSPGWAAGLRDNDVVTSIDGHPITASYPDPAKRIGFQPAGTHVSLGISGGRYLNIALNYYF